MEGVRVLLSLAAPDLGTREMCLHPARPGREGASAFSRSDVHTAWVLGSERLGSALLPTADCMETRVPRSVWGRQGWDRAGILTQPGVKALVLVEESGPVVLKVGSPSLHRRHLFQKQRRCS